MSDLANTYRFFVAPTMLQGEMVHIADRELAHQLGRVLRLRPDDRILLLDGQGEACEVRLTAIEREAFAGHIERRFTAGGEPPLRITLYLALLRGERFEWALQKGAELGVARFVPVHCARSLPNERTDERRLTRWRRIVREAAEQSCRGLLPEVTPPQAFSAACAESVGEQALLLWEGEAPPLGSYLRSLGATPGAVAFYSGPEGGFTEDELTCARQRGIIPVSLGPRILRAETAPLAAVAALCYEFELS